MTTINFNYKELKQENIELVTEENYIEIYNNLTKGLEEEITKKFKNKLTHYNYIKILTEIENTMTYFKNKPFEEYQEEIIKLLNEIAKLRKKIFEVSMNKKVEIFMNYIENNNIPSQNSNIKFCDIDNSVKDRSYVGKWIKRQLYSNLAPLKEELEKYKYIYPFAYQKVIKTIEKLPQSQKIAEKTKEKIEIFLKNLENGTLDLPMKTENITFLDLKPNINSKSKVKEWLKNIISKNREEFLKYCNEKKDIYPFAYQKVIDFLPDTNRVHLDTELRLKLLMIYANKKAIPNKNSKLTFYDIDNKYNDKRKVMTWLYEKLINNQKEINNYLEKYKEEYPLGYCRINNKIIEIKQERTRIQKTRQLNLKEKTRIVMKYLETNELPTAKDKTTFKDLIPDVTSRTTIYSWIINNILSDKNKVFKIIEQYKNIYPEACKKIYVKFGQLETERYNIKRTISFEEKVKLFMMYINEHQIPSEGSYIRFNSIDKTIEDNSSVGYWTRDQISKNLYRLYIEITKYKDIYPVAYKKIIAKINISEPRIDKYRKKLIYALKAVKEDLEYNERKYKTRIKKS